jgi:hypothetical protein
MPDRSTLLSTVMSARRLPIYVTEQIRHNRGLFVPTTVDRSIKIMLLLLAAVCAGDAQAPPDLQAKLDTEMKHLKEISHDSQVVDAVKAYNSTAQSGEARTMTNEKWHSLAILDPFVRSIGKNALSEFLKTRRDDVIVKIFVSGADGGKVGFDAKTEHWTHKGMPKHEVPMSGKIWVSPVKLDDSTGLQMIQIGLPVENAEKPIGSIVFGLRADKLR